MKITVLPLIEARAYQTQNISYGIIILNNQQITTKLAKEVYQNLSKQCVQTREYIFDKMTPHDKRSPGYLRKNGVLFTKDKAIELIGDFRRRPKDLDELIVTDEMGLNRSAAVAIALNKKFELGQNNKVLRQEHNHFSHYIYNLIINV